MAKEPTTAKAKTPGVEYATAWQQHTRFGTYDAVEDKNQRKTPSSTIKGEDDILTATKRKKLQRAARDLTRNFSVAGWMVRKHLDWVANVTFQSRCHRIETRTPAAATELEALDEQIEKLVAEWAQPRNFDIAARHGLFRSLRMAEACRVIDGDCLYALISSGRTQAIESDRLRDPPGRLPEQWANTTFKHGIASTKGGRATAYAICNRSAYGNYELDKILPARFTVLHAWYDDRFDQARGVSPWRTAINPTQDAYEAATWARLKMKLSQMFGLATFRDDDDALGEVEGEGDTETDRPFEVDFDKGPFHLDLAPEDRAEFLESNSPSQEFQSFWLTTIMAALKALDLPYSFYDEKHTNYFGSRAALNLYLLSAEVKRRDVRALATRLLRWRQAMWVANGELSIPSYLTLGELRHEWPPAGVPWWNPAQEAKGDILALNAGLTTYDEVLRPRGLEFRDVVERLAAQRKFMAERLGEDFLATPAAQAIGEKS